MHETKAKAKTVTPESGPLDTVSRFGSDSYTAMFECLRKGDIVGDGNLFPGVSGFLDGAVARKGDVDNLYCRRETKKIEQRSRSITKWCPGRNCGMTALEKEPREDRQENKSTC
jgi:hypothetical protein